MSTVTAPSGRVWQGPLRETWAPAHGPNDVFFALWQSDGVGGFYSLPGQVVDGLYPYPPPVVTLRDVNGVSQTQYLRDWVVFSLGSAYVPTTAKAICLGIKLIITGDDRQEEVAIWFAARRRGATTGSYPTDFAKWAGAGQTVYENQAAVYPVAQSRRLTAWADVRDWASIWVPLTPDPVSGVPTFEYAWGARLATRPSITAGIAVGLGIQGWAR